MIRAIPLAALALACVCSSAMAATLSASPKSTASVVWVLITGIGLGLSLGLGIAALRLRSEMRRTLCFFGLVASMIFVVGPAMAAEVATVGNTAVILPYGQWITAIAQTATEILVPIIIAAIGVAARKLPWYASMWFTTQRIDRMVRLAADYALNSVAGATAGKAVTVDVGYTVIKVGLERALGSSPQWLIDAAGGTKGITERLFRAFHFDETVTDKNTLLPLQRDLGVVEPLTEKRYPPPTADELRDAERMTRD